MDTTINNDAQERVAALWDSYTPKLYGYLMNAVHDRTLADDLLQQTWMKAIATIDRYEERGHGFGAYLFTIARNECRQHWRKSGREVDLERAEHLPAPTTTPDDALEVERILAYLSDDDRELLRLRYIADLAVQDIARVLGISVTATSVRIHRTLKRARKLSV
ncbi:MAG: sigma-70 family RNA polymerase sigma factor [bacterium]|nr:sigma-70 family RNA polymerase sigma factor [bacterium]